MKILLIAEQANPEWVSVPLIGWSLATAIQSRVSAHIVTQVRNRDAFLRRGLVEGEDFTAIDNEDVAARLHGIARRVRGGDGKGWTTVTALESLAYYSFENRLWKKFGKRIRAKEFDVVHRITPLSPTAPSLIASKIMALGVPFVVGPLNGGLPWPANFEHRRRAEREWLSYVRSLYRLLPRSKSTFAHASAIVVASDATAKQIPKRFRSKLYRLPENAVDISRFHQRKAGRTDVSVLTAVFVGRLVSYKCPDLLLKAAATAMLAGRLRLTIVGDGPLREDLVKLAKELGVAEKTTFMGWLSHEDIHDALLAADFLVLPSIREFGGGVVLEALACGLPVIVADYGGPAELVNSEVGVKVPFDDESSLLRNLREAINEFVQRPETVAAMGERAFTYAREHHTWGSRATRMIEIYNLVPTQKE